MIYNKVIMCSTTTGQLADFTLSFLHPSFHNQQQKQAKQHCSKGVY